MLRYILLKFVTYKIKCRSNSSSSSINSSSSSCSSNINKLSYRWSDNTLHRLSA